MSWKKNSKDLKSSMKEGFVVFSDLKRQMGNARYLIIQSSSTLKSCRLIHKLMGVKTDNLCFEEKKFLKMRVCVSTKMWYLGGDWHRTNGPAIEYSNGDKEWWFKGKKHRIDGPAEEASNGFKSWWVEGKLHREDGPAIEFSNGDKVWYFDRKIHREDGPAIEFSNGCKEWYFEGERMK